MIKAGKNYNKVRLSGAVENTFSTFFMLKIYFTSMILVNLIINLPYVLKIMYVGWNKMAN